jgi:hypothetical protein
VSQSEAADFACSKYPPGAFSNGAETSAETQEIIMAILQSKPKADPMEIPPELRRAPPNGAGDTSAAIISQLQAEIAALKAAKGTLTFKVSEKGALSIYGMGRFPVSLYREQWERLLAQKDAILAFIEANADRLSVKA